MRCFPPSVGTAYSHLGRPALWIPRQPGTGLSCRGVMVCNFLGTQCEFERKMTQRRTSKNRRPISSRTIWQSKKQLQSCQRSSWGIMPRSQMLLLKDYFPQSLGLWCSSQPHVWPWAWGFIAGWNNKGEEKRGCCMYAWGLTYKVEADNKKWKSCSL